MKLYKDKVNKSRNENEQLTLIKVIKNYRQFFNFKLFFYFFGLMNMISCVAFFFLSLLFSL